MCIVKETIYWLNYCTAVSHKMIMVTENVDDFKNIKDIEIENWIDRNL